MITTWKKLFVIAGVSLVLGSCLDTEEKESQLDREIQAIDRYIQSQGLAQNTLYDNSRGTRYSFKPFESSYGYGIPARPGHTVRISYMGRVLANDTLSSVPFVMVEDEEKKLEEVRPSGLALTVDTFLEGAYLRAFIPSNLAFGKEGTTGVPPNSIVVYDVIIHEVNLTALEQQRFESDTTDIINYLEENEIEATYYHRLWIDVTEEGSVGGKTPTPYDAITADYKVTLLSNRNNIIDQGTLTQESLLGLVDAFKIALPQLQEGAKATLYVPSLLGYGPSANGAIPANSILVFDIELKTVHR